MTTIVKRINANEWLTNNVYEFERCISGIGKLTELKPFSRSVVRCDGGVECRTNSNGEIKVTGNYFSIACVWNYVTENTA